MSVFDLSPRERIVSERRECTLGELVVAAGPAAFVLSCEYNEQQVT